MARSENIFFVDDEPKIRDVVSETLEELGLKVSCFASAVDCLEQLGSKRCDLLITDVKIPEMDGMEFLAKAKRLAPWLPVLVPKQASSLRLPRSGADDFTGT